MRFYKKGVARKLGLPPGTLIHTGDYKSESVSMELISYDEHTHRREKIEELESLANQINNNEVFWLNVNGIHDSKVIEKIGQLFDLHPLILEDIMSSGQRPKAEYYPNCIFMVVNMLRFESGNQNIDSEQVSLILKDNFVITFQEKAGDVFDPIRERIKLAKGRIRKEKGDYLCYALLDVIVDNYFLILEQIGEIIENLEQDMVTKADSYTLKQLHDLKRNMIFIRKTIWPLRELIRSLERTEFEIIDRSNLIYYRDVYDHIIQVIDIVESSRDILAGMLDIYLSSVSNKMNEVMKVLTIIATIFIPLTFIAGVYGMNFEFMPELQYRWAYPVILLLMVAVAGVMLIFFKKRKWL